MSKPAIPWPLVCSEYAVAAADDDDSYDDDGNGDGDGDVNDNDDNDTIKMEKDAFKYRARWCMYILKCFIATLHANSFAQPLAAAISSA